jgi:hypothetical protein
MDHEVLLPFIQGFYLDARAPGCICRVISMILHAVAARVGSHVARIAVRGAYINGLGGVPCASAARDGRDDPEDRAPNDGEAITIPATAPTQAALAPAALTAESTH